MEHGSFHNMIMGDSKAGPPAPGDGATLVFWTDRHAATVTRVAVGRTGRVRVWVREDKAIRTDGNPGGPAMTELQTYRYEPDPEAREIEVRWHAGERKKGWYTTTGTRVVFGYRDNYYDYSF